MSVLSEAEEIQRIAYELWQIDGEPFGREHEHWERARRILQSRKAFSGNSGQTAGGAAVAPRMLGGGPDQRGMVSESKAPAPDPHEPPLGRFAGQMQTSRLGLQTQARSGERAGP